MLLNATRELFWIARHWKQISLPLVIYERSLRHSGEYWRPDRVGVLEVEGLETPIPFGAIILGADPGPEALILADVPKGFLRERREECLYHWHPASYILTNETHYGRVGRFFDLADAKRFLVECLDGVVVEEVES